MDTEALAPVLFLIGVVLLASGWIIRMRMFYSLKDDPVAEPLLEGTFITTFTDFLWLHLYRARDRIDGQYRSKIAAYFWLTLATVAFWLMAFAVYWLAT